LILFTLKTIIQQVLIEFLEYILDLIQYTRRDNILQQLKCGGMAKW